MLRKQLYERINGLKAGLILFFILGLLVSLPGEGLYQQDPVQYEVDVRAQIVPIFAVDSKGNPVYDLKEEEIEFYVNGKPAEISAFTPYAVEGLETGGGKAGKKFRETINFIILDSVMNSRLGVKRGKEVARDLIEAAGPGDAFVVLESNQGRGFRYVIGPEKDKKKLIGTIKDIFQTHNPHKLYHLPPTLATKPGSKEEEFQDRISDMNAMDVESGRKQYQQEIVIFTRALSQLKYALKTITLPKNIFLITSAMKEVALKGVKRKYRNHIVENNLAYYYNFLKDASIAVNYGGSMLYLINPNKTRSVGSNDSLKFMAEVSGGKCFYGRSIPDIVEKVKKNTSAYYELAFALDSRSDDRVKIKLKCKRKGIKLNTINYSERAKPYKEMLLIQKKLFALNVINGGTWSRMVGKIEQTRYKKIKTAKTGASTRTKMIEVAVPKSLRNTAADIFLVNMDPKSLKAAIGVQSKLLGEKEKIAVPVLAGKDQYVVMVEPNQTHCIYTPVK
ncbi:MAG: hypothetical protein GY950_07585 [bacterium]|nr:hypothetical protein [bacterium]